MFLYRWWAMPETPREGPLPTMTLILNPPPASTEAAPKRRTRVFALAEARWAAAATVAFLLALPLQLTGVSAWAWGPLYQCCPISAAGGNRPGPDCRL
jgi:hypothetical protein